MDTDTLCGICGPHDCVCDDPAFELCVIDRDRDSIVQMLGRCKALEAEQDRTSKQIHTLKAERDAALRQVREKSRTIRSQYEAACEDRRRTL